MRQTLTVHSAKKTTVGKISQWERQAMLKPFIIYRCLPNYSEDGNFYMFLYDVLSAEPWKMLSDKAKTLGLVYGPIVQAVKHLPCETD